MFPNFHDAVRTASHSSSPRRSRMVSALKYSRTSGLQVIDQLKLPGETVFIDVVDADAGWEVIRSMNVRGAPLIAIVGALSVAVEISHGVKPNMSAKEAASLVVD